MIFILSMHRSGSSLLAGLMKENGYFLGSEKDLIPANKDNKKGFMERRDVVDLNESIIAKGPFGHMLPDADNELDSSFAQEKIKRLLVELEQERVDLVKDPRFCLTISEWAKHVDSPFILFLTRNPIEVARSLERRQSYPLLGGLALWEYYNYQALKSTKGLNVFHIDFSQLVSDPNETILSIENWLRPDARKEAESADSTSFVPSSQFYESKLHDRSTTADQEHLLSVEQNKLYRWLQNPSLPYSGPYSSIGMKSMLCLMKQFAEIGYVPNTGRMLDEKHAKRIEKLEHDLAGAWNKNRELREALDRRRREYQDLIEKTKGLSLLIERFEKLRKAGFLKSVYLITSKIWIKTKDIMKR